LWTGNSAIPWNRANLLDVEWASIARRQGGIISRAQLIELGYTADMIAGLKRRGRLSSTGNFGVYRAPGSPDSSESAAWTAVLATNSPLTYLSAAEAWDVPVPDDGKIHITRFDRRRLAWPAGVRVHRVALDPVAVTKRYGWPVTTRTETILDCLGWLQIGDARNLADRAQQQRWLSPTDIERRLENQPGRWGNRQLRRLLPTLGDGAHSRAERILHKILRAAQIVGWLPNHSVVIAGKRYVIDLAWPEEMIAIEVDGYGEHSKRDAFQRDRTKQNDLIAAGWTVLRFTWRDLVDRPQSVVIAIDALLAR
jgi:very-short-patch-repair endonuclease